MESRDTNMGEILANQPDIMKNKEDKNCLIDGA
jgi:hypothetical protein